MTDVRLRIAMGIFAGFSLGVGLTIDALDFAGRIAPASGMSACGQDPEEGLEAKPASPAREAGDAR